MAKTEKQIIEWFCGEEIHIIDTKLDTKGCMILCKRDTFPNKQFLYIVKKGKVILARSKKI